MHIIYLQCCSQSHLLSHLFNPISITKHHHRIPKVHTLIYSNRSKLGNIELSPFYLAANLKAVLVICTPLHDMQQSMRFLILDTKYQQGVG